MGSTLEQFSSCLFKQRKFWSYTLDSGDLFCEFYFKLFESRLNLNILLRILLLTFFKGRTHYYIVFIITFKMKGNNRSLLSDMSHLKIEEASFNFKFLSKPLTCQRMSKNKLCTMNIEQKPLIYSRIFN